MKNINRYILLVAALAMIAGPVFAGTESAQPAAGLTKADFTGSGSKLSEVNTRYERYQYQLNHPRPVPALSASNIRKEGGEAIQSLGMKPSAVRNQSERSQYGAKYSGNKTHAYQRPLSGKPIVDGRAA